MFERTFSFWRRLVGKNAPVAEAGQDERRVWVRYPAKIKTTISVNGMVEPTRSAAAVRDISLGGANLVVDREFAAGSMLTLELPRTSQGERHEVLACVVRVVLESPGVWSLGCVFSRELTDQDLEGFGAKRVRPDPPDQRIWKRFSVTLRARIQKVGPLDAPIHEGKILNLSPSGIGVLVNTNIEAGALLSVDLIDNAKETVKTILACVVHVTEHANGERSLGCNFIRQLQEEEVNVLIRT